MAARPDTREDILRTSGRLLQTRGYNGFSYAHVGEELGIKTAAVHYHFPSKTDLGVALVQRYHQRYQRWMVQAQHMAPWDQLDGYLSIFEHFLKDGGRTCPASALMAEWGAIPPEVQAEVKTFMKEAQGWLTVVLEEGRAKHAFFFAGEAEDRAAAIAATCQGALQLARVMGRDAFHAAVRQLRQDLRE